MERPFSARLLTVEDARTPKSLRAITAVSSREWLDGFYVESAMTGQSLVRKRKSVNRKEEQDESGDNDDDDDDDKTWSSVKSHQRTKDGKGKIESFLELGFLFSSETRKNAET